MVRSPKSEDYLVVPLHDQEQCHYTTPRAGHVHIRAGGMVAGGSRSSAAEH